MFVRVLTIAVALSVAGCEKTNDETIDKWMKTAKGTDKLKKALADENLDPDLSAHAGANLVKKQLDNELRAGLDQMSPGRQTQVIGRLAPRLWNIARVEDEKMLPGAPQIQGKDALVMIRKYADDAQKQQIDGYLIDWYAVASYEGRANSGAHLGAQVIRLVGAPAGKKLMGVVSSVIAAPGQDKTKNKIGDELLLGLAVSGNPEAVRYVLDIARMDRGDPTLRRRAISALWKAYVDPGGLFDIAPAEPLAPNLPAIVALLKDPGVEGGAINDLVGLITAVGGPACTQEMLAAIPMPHDRRFKYVAATSALRCGGVKAVRQVVQALPDTGAYEQAELEGTVVREIAKLTPRDQVLATLRTLLGEKSLVSRWVAIETLAFMKSVEDRPRISALSGNRDKLAGYWGETGKPDPTLGHRAKELADQLSQTTPPK
jgi:hypothetical protein